jgi:hypothetical protein
MRRFFSIDLSSCGTVEKSCVESISYSEEHLLHRAVGVVPMLLHVPDIATSLVIEICVHM